MNRWREVYHLCPWTSLSEEQLNYLNSLGKLTVSYEVPEFVREDPMRDYGSIMYWDELSDDERLREYWTGIPRVYEDVHKFLFDSLIMEAGSTFKFSDFYNYIVKDRPIYKDSEQRLRSILEHYMMERLEYSYRVEETENPGCLYDVEYILDSP